MRTLLLLPWCLCQYLGKGCRGIRGEGQLTVRAGSVCSFSLSSDSRRTPGNGWCYITGCWRRLSIKGSARSPAGWKTVGLRPWSSACSFSLLCSLDSWSSWPEAAQRPMAASRLAPVLCPSWGTFCRWTEKACSNPS